MPYGTSEKFKNRLNGLKINIFHLNEEQRMYTI